MMSEMMINFFHGFYAAVEERKENLFLISFFSVKVILFY